MAFEVSSRWTAVAIVAATGCLSTSLARPPSVFPCPDGICPAGYTCAASMCVASTSSTGSASSGAASTGTTSSSGSSSGSTGSTSSSSTGASSSSGSSSGVSGSSSGAASGVFAGEWDTNFAHVSLTQNGAAVTGMYRYWGYTYLDSESAGTISGTAQGSVFNGTFQANNPKDPAVPLTWTLAGSGAGAGLAGTYQYLGQPAYPWCGVAAGQGTPLPSGCGWSDHFDGPFSAVGGAGPSLMQQVADEVTGYWYRDDSGAAAGINGTIFGVVSDFRVNGEYFNTLTPPPAGLPGRFSFWMTPDGTQFSGNYFIFNDFFPWCGGRTSSHSSAPTTCLGGGGIYDGTWFTNLGTITLTEPQPNTSPALGVWFGWNSDTEYAITGLVSGPDAGPSTDYSLSWTDSSALGGASELTSVPSDSLGLTLTGQAVAGGLWCGVNYGANPLLPDGGQIGALFPGCGLSNNWTMWQPTATNPLHPPQLVQTRGSVTGTIDPPFNADSVSGTVGLNPLQGAGVGSWTIVTGDWTDLPDAGGAFTWYPDSQDQSFSGDFATAAAIDAGAWCGSLSTTQPSPCYQ